MLEKIVRHKKLETEAEVVEATINCLQSVSPSFQEVPRLHFVKEWEL